MSTYRPISSVIRRASAWMCHLRAGPSPTWGSQEAVSIYHHSSKVHKREWIDSTRVASITNSVIALVQLVVASIYLIMAEGNYFPFLPLVPSESKFLAVAWFRSEASQYSALTLSRKRCEYSWKASGKKLELHYCFIDLCCSIIGI